MMATVGSNPGSVRSTASPRMRRRNGPRTYRFMRTSRHSSWTGKSSIATSGSPCPAPRSCRVLNDAASPPECEGNLRPGATKGKGQPAHVLGEEGLLDLADAQPAEVDVGGAVPAEGGDRTAPGDGHGHRVRAAQARIAAVGAVVGQLVDLRPGDAIGVVV